MKEYLKKIKEGASAGEAEKAAIHKGLANENGILGLWPSGVFSYGDMEANYQGFRFYKKLCLDDADTFLENEDGLWKLAKVPDIREFVNPYWDESFNLSWRASGMWRVTGEEILKKYCPLKESAEVQTRFKYYQDFLHTSRSLEYIKELQDKGYSRAPNPSETQSVDKLCEAVKI